MGVDGSKLSKQQEKEQTDLLMQQNVELARHLSHQQHAAHKSKHGSMINEVGKKMFANVKLKNNGATAENQMKQIEIEGVTYEIIDFISKGGFGQVYKAQARNSNRIVAIKIMQNKPDIREEIQNEINFLTKLARPGHFARGSNSSLAGRLGKYWRYIGQTRFVLQCYC
ncbi:unnamed protein product [Rotaria sp. Silwood1]|nr:unnamed protein product [Rotaria sp. Silwood1]